MFVSEDVYLRGCPPGPPSLAGLQEGFKVASNLAEARMLCMPLTCHAASGLGGLACCFQARGPTTLIVINTRGCCGYKGLGRERPTMSRPIIRVEEPMHGRGGSGGQKMHTGSYACFSLVGLLTIRSLLHVGPPALTLPIAPRAGLSLRGCTSR